MRIVKRLLKRIRNYGEKLLMSRAEYKQYKELSKKDRAAYHELNKGYKRVFKLMSKTIARNHINKITKHFLKRTKGKASVREIQNEIEKSTREIQDAKDNIYVTLRSFEQGVKVEATKEPIQRANDGVEILIDKEQPEIKIHTVKIQEREIQILKRIHEAQNKETSRSR